ncbi:MAG: glycosyltransferase [Thermoguttaceae bacterium]
MAHYAIICPDLAGHLVPDASLGTALIERGHQVTLVAGPRAAPIAAEMGLKHYVLDLTDEPAVGSWMLWKAFCALGLGWITSQRDGFNWFAGALLRKLPAIIREQAIDGVVLDHTALGGGTAAEHVGVPFVTLWAATPFNEDPALPPGFTGWRYGASWRTRLRNRLGYAGWRWFIAPTLRTINRYRRSWNLPTLLRIDNAYSQLAQLSQWFPGFDFPRSRVPDCFHYVGWLAADRPFRGGNFPWQRLDGRPLIYASMGTVDDPANRPIYAKIAAACMGLHAQLVIERRTPPGAGAMCPWSTLQQPAQELPGNPLIVDSVPPLVLLERTALMITHAGTNTIFECISRGVPMVALPRAADQPGNAARMEYAGAGLISPFHGGRPEDLRKVIERVLTDQRFRRRTEELNAAMRAAGGAARAAEIVEQAFTTGRPVLAGSAGSEPVPTRTSHGLQQD